MSERRVWIAQCLCPDRHCIMAAAGEADSEDDARQTVRAPLRRKVATLLRNARINPRCALCGADRATWRYELGRTAFTTIEAATPVLAEIEAAQAVTNALWGDIHKGRPH